MDFPNLSGVITPQDISSKGSGSYSADYINWAKVAHLLNTHANGWQFRLRLTSSNSHVWEAPNGTGYIVGYFVSPDGSETADFPQAVMDNRNNAVPFAKISARDLTDTHRRALCAAACFNFGLAYQLWAKEKIENPFRDEPSTKPQPLSVVHDDDGNHHHASGSEPIVETSSTSRAISAAQLKRLMAIANEHSVTDDQQKAIVTHRFGFNSRKLITTDKYDEIVQAYQTVNAGDVNEAEREASAYTQAINRPVKVRTEFEPDINT